MVKLTDGTKQNMKCKTNLFFKQYILNKSKIKKFVLIVVLMDLLFLSSKKVTFITHREIGFGKFFVIALSHILGHTLGTKMSVSFRSFNIRYHFYVVLSTNAISLYPLAIPVLC